LKPGIEPNPQAKSIETLVTPKGTVHCDF